MNEHQTDSAIVWVAVSVSAFVDFVALKFAPALATTKLDLRCPMAAAAMVFAFASSAVALTVNWHSRLHHLHLELGSLDQDCRTSPLLLGCGVTVDVMSMQMRMPEQFLMFVMIQSTHPPQPVVTLTLLLDRLLCCSSVASDGLAGRAIA